MWFRTVKICKAYLMDNEGEVFISHCVIGAVTVATDGGDSHDIWTYTHEVGSTSGKNPARTTNMAATQR